MRNPLKTIKNTLEPEKQSSGIRNWGYTGLADSSPDIGASVELAKRLIGRRCTGNKPGAFTDSFLEDRDCAIEMNDGIATLLSDGRVQKPA